MPVQPNRLLVMTVGVGDADHLDETLFAPLRKSIRKGEWERVVLLPSQMTRPNAEVLQSGADGPAVESMPLPEPGMEDDVDACFHHFDGVLAGLIATGAPPHRIVVDFTRGTKAMSAGLVLASVSRGVNVLRYIHGPRDKRGTVVAGREVIQDINAAVAVTRRDLERAGHLLDSFQFVAAADLFPATVDHWSMGMYPESLKAEIGLASWVAHFWGAWDRFDYAHAAQLLKQEPRLALAGWERFVPLPGNRAMVTRLANGVPAGIPERVCYVRDLVADLLASAQRRLNTGAWKTHYCGPTVPSR